MTGNSISHTAEQQNDCRIEIASSGEIENATDYYNNPGFLGFVLVVVRKLGSHASILSMTSLITSVAILHCGSVPCDIVSKREAIVTHVSRA